ncbi:MAG: tail-specific protease [Pirellulaceae bacterium]|nr:MAG: tail-specific protease [Pirellulaceae bacterium]GIW93247.1 MAG: tail-specific protease [Pirellulaceae bacterium]
MRRRWTMVAGWMAVGLVVAGVGIRLAADLTPPGGRERQVTLKVVDLLTRQHLSQHPLDDEIAARALPLLLESFDPLKLYFTRADVEEFRRSQSQLDDWLKQGRIEFGYQVYQRFVQRIDERLQLVEKLLAQPVDFTIDETIVLDRKSLDYPATPEEITDRWRKRIKYDLLVLKAEKVEGDQARERLLRRYQNFARRMKQFDNDELMETYINAFAMSFDPHTSYMSPSQLENFRIMMRLNLEGIGAQLQTDDYGHTVVAKIVPGGAADKHGKLKPQDQIVSVGQGDDGEMVDVVDMKLTDVVKLIRGKAGTVVRLGVLSPNEQEIKIYRIVRAKIELKDSEARGEIFPVGRKPSGEAYRVGVVDLPSFYMDMEASRLNADSFKSTTRDVQAILERFNKEGVDAVVLDLRRNGGGSLVEAINLTGLFIDEGPVVQVRDSSGTVEHYDDPVRGMVWAGPLVVLTSKFSASASEILAGAIQDYRRGLIIGDPATHGKGTVQTLRELGERLFPIANPPNQGAIKITVQEFYRPSGDSTQQRGVLADITLPSLTAHMPGAESDLEYSLPFSRVQPVRYTPYRLVSADMIKVLAERSQARVARSPDFQKLQATIDRYLAQRERKSVSLQEEKFFADRAQLDAAREEEKKIDELENNSANIKRDYYLDEVFAITVDYLELLREQAIAASR